MILCLLASINLNNLWIVSVSLYKCAYTNMNSNSSFFMGGDESLLSARDVQKYRYRQCQPFFMVSVLVSVSGKLMPILPIHEWNLFLKEKHLCKWLAMIRKFDDKKKVSILYFLYLLLIDDIVDICLLDHCCICDVKQKLSESYT